MRFESYPYKYDYTAFGCQSREHLRLKKESALQKHINVCQSCKVNKQLFDNFFILKACYTQHSTITQEALLIKMHNPKLNSQIYAKFFLFFVKCVFAHLLIYVWCNV